MYNYRALLLPLGLVFISVPCLLATQEYFYLRNTNTGKCLDVVGSPGQYNRANIQVYECEFNERGSDQIWTMTNDGQLVSRPSGKCLDVKGYQSTSNSISLQLFECESIYNKRTDHIWHLDFDPCAAVFRIKNNHTGKCVDVKGYAETGNGVDVQQYTCEHFSRSTDQWWHKVPVSC